MAGLQTGLPSGFGRRGSHSPFACPAQADPKKKGEIMTESSENGLCVTCGRPLDKKDIRDKRGDCQDCRSPWGKLAELEIAIRSM